MIGIAVAKSSEKFVSKDDNMVFYLTNTYNDRTRLLDRRPSSSEAGKNRNNYIISNLGTDVEVITWAASIKKGFNSSVIDTYVKKRGDFKTKYFYPFCLNIKFFRSISMAMNVAMRLLREAKKEDIIICYNAYPNRVLPIIISRLFKKTKMIFEIEELYSKTDYFKGIKGKLIRFTENYMIRNSDGYIIVSSKMREYLNPDKPILLNFGYETKVKPAELLYEGRDVIVYSGRLDFAGGIELFLSSLLYMDDDIKVVITGKGKLETRVRQFISCHKELDIEYLGLVDDETLNAVIYNAKVCVSPIRLSNRFSDVSFPSKLLMYLSYGCNVVSSEFPGLQLLVDKFDNIFIYDEDDGEVLANTIKKALKVPTDKHKNMETLNDFFEKQNKELKAFFNTML